MEINKILGNHREPEQPIELLSDNEVEVKEKVRLADTFNEYFTSIGKKLGAGAGFDDVSDSGVVHDRNLSSIFLLKLLVQSLEKLLTGLM
jgi:hypothetical protein